MTSHTLADHETDSSGGSLVNETAGDAGTLAYTEERTSASDCKGGEVGRETARVSVFQHAVRECLSPGAARSREAAPGAEQSALSSRRERP